MSFLRVCLVALAVLAAMASPGRAQTAGNAYVISYLEVASADRGKAAALLRAMRDAARKEPGNLGFDVMENTARREHFVLIETWQDAKAEEAHAAADAAKALRDQLKAMLVAPYDERPHSGFVVGATKAHGKRVVYVVTHVDFQGAKKDVGLEAIKRLSSASGSDAGMLRYDVLQQTSKPNHVTLVEIWKNKAALEAHEQAAHTRKFRDELMPIGGSPYDELIVRPID